MTEALSSSFPHKKTNRDKIIEFLKQNKGKWFDDDKISKLLGIKPRQQVNQICRQLANEGVIQRSRVGGKMKNSIGGETETRVKLDELETAKIKDVKLLELGPEGLYRYCYEKEEGLTELELKAALAFHLQNNGFTVEVSYRGAPGPDIIAQKEHEKLIIEVKGEGKYSQMRENYFLAVIGEICIRMDDPHAKYMVAVPAHKDFVNKILNFPQLAKQKLDINFILGRKIEEGIYHLYLLKQS